MIKKSLLILIICLILVGCTNKTKEEKEVKTLSDFQTACNSLQMGIKNKSASYQGLDYIKEALACTLPNGDLEMVIYDGAEAAKDVQKKQIESFSLLKTTNTVKNEEEGVNYYRYEMISNGYYMISSRVDNTLIFTKILLDDKDNVTTILNQIGY